MLLVLLVAHWGLFNDVLWLEKQQIIHRLPPEFVVKVLSQFNDGSLSCAEACLQLDIAQARLYQLRTEWLRQGHAFKPHPSGGNHRSPWPSEVHRFIEDFVPLQKPPNYQLVCDELKRLHNFTRARSTVEAYVKTNFPHLIPSKRRKPTTFRRFRRARIGELWQHDSSIHQWWPAPTKQVLLLTVDDHSGLNLAGRFVKADTTWNHFCHFRSIFERHGIPEAIYTDGLSLFGPSSSSDHADPKSQFQRALSALSVAHLVAPTPQAKGKIERRFGTFQKRLVTLMAHAEVRDWEAANEVLQMEINRQNATKSRSIDARPDDIWQRALQGKDHAIKDCPVRSLLDLHISLRTTRAVSNTHTIDFEGRTYQIAKTLKKRVHIVYHPNRQFWALETMPSTRWPTVLGHFSL